MSREKFRAKAYVKEGCPFSFKFLTFMTEAGLLDEIEIVRLREGDADYEAAKQKLTEHLGKASFPTVELGPNEYMTDSDRLIEHYAKREGLKPDEMPVLALYKQGILPKLFELHKLKTGGAKS
ncbi:MAG TPA: glutathione S-transferase N-terminal domain-containing protein [Gammaproteobacteria bacterium]|nr:glutathione S-transferase N-terminal domain-containing protein [Gammaproteobacteria bacterium]